MKYIKTFESIFDTDNFERIPLNGIQELVKKYPRCQFNKMDINFFKYMHSKFNIRYGFSIDNDNICCKLSYNKYYLSISKHEDEWFLILKYGIEDECNYGAYLCNEIEGVFDYIKVLKGKK